MTLPATNLQELTVGGQFGNVASIRFQAATKYVLQSSLASRLLYWIDNAPGYSGGTKGIFAHELRTDINGQPGVLICEGTESGIIRTPTGKGKFSRICFPPDVFQLGAWYHHRIPNIDPNPKVNFSSLDFLANPKNPNFASLIPTSQILVQQGGSGLYKLLDGGTVAASPISDVYFDGTIVENDGYQVENGVVLSAGPEYGFVGGAS
jgi:hypothetical protein